MKDYTFFPDPASIDASSISQIEHKDIYKFWSINDDPLIINFNK